MQEVKNHQTGPEVNNPVLPANIEDRLKTAVELKRQGLRGDELVEAVNKKFGSRVLMKGSELAGVLVIIIIALAIAAILSIQGCNYIKLQKTMPDGTTLTGEYIRWLNQHVDGFKLRSPEGWEVSFERQLSDTEIAFGLGAASVSVGGGEK